MIHQLRRSIPIFLGAAAMAAVLYACATAPITGRQQFIMLPDSEMNAMGLDAAKEITTKEPVERGTQHAAMVERVGRRIAAVSDAPGYQWSFNLIAKDIPNAFCLPGGKVFVYEGLFKYARTEEQLAAVMSHEVAHALARHGAERMSMSMAAQGVGAVAGSALGNPNFAQAFGVAANYGVILPYSRTQESEADRIGLILMAKAGYPPEAAVTLWQNMMQVPGGKTPEFMSTHPATETRIRDIKAHLPEARSYYRGG